VSCGTRWSPARVIRSRDGDGVSAGGEPIWLPDPAEVTAANVSRFARWLTERYCLYTVHRRTVYRGEIHHVQWPLQDADAEFETNTVASAAGVFLPATAPRLHRTLDQSYCSERTRRCGLSNSPQPLQLPRNKGRLGG